PGQDGGDQAVGVGASQASQRYRVGVRDLAALMPGDNVLEQLQLSLVEPLRLRQCAKRIDNSRERIAPCGIVVDPFHNLVASGNGCLDHFRREPRSAEGTVRSSVVLVRAEAVPTEHEGSVHVEEHGAKAGEDVGCRHARGWLSGSWNRYQWTRLVRPGASPLACGATRPRGAVWSNDSSCAPARNTALPVARSPPGSIKRWRPWGRSAGHGSSPTTAAPFSTSAVPTFLRVRFRTTRATPSISPVRGQSKTVPR